MSVVTPARNAASFIRETILSVRQQTFRDFEHLVVDDGSADGTGEILVELAREDPRIRTISLKEAVGAVGARNAGMEKARGRYVAFLDADDTWLPKKLELQIGLMDRSRCTMSYTDYRHMDASGHLVGSVVEGPSRATLDRIYGSRFIACSSVMLNLELEPGFRFPQIFPAVRAEDLVAWANLVKRDRVALRCPHDLLRYRLSPASRSARKLRGSRSVWRIYRHIEGMSLARAAVYFVRFAINASWKHVHNKPRFARSVVDKDSQDPASCAS